MMRAIILMLMVSVSAYGQLTPANEYSPFSNAEDYMHDQFTLLNASDAFVYAAQLLNDAEIAALIILTEADSIRIDNLELDVAANTLKNSADRQFFIDSLGVYIVNIAFGDSVTDATAAIQATFDAAGLNGKVEFPAGVFIISDSISKNVQMNIQGSGGGNATKIIQTVDKPIFKINYNDALLAWWPISKISDIVFQGTDNAGHTNQHGILAEGELNLVIDNCVFVNNGGYGIKFDNSRTHVYNCVVRDCKIGANNAGGAWAVGDDQNWNCNNISFIRNNLNVNHGHALTVWGLNIVLDDNAIQGNDSCGIFVSDAQYAGESSCLGLSIINNYVEVNGGSSIYFENGYISPGDFEHFVDGVIIEGNMFLEESASVEKPEADGVITFQLEPNGNDFGEYYRNVYVGTNHYTSAGSLVNVSANELLKESSTVYITDDGNAEFTNLYKVNRIGWGNQGVYRSASLTDGAPTDSEIDTATGLTPATAGAGYTITILDSDGSGLTYIIKSDGTNWLWTVGAIAT